MAISQDANKRERFKQLLRKIGSGEHTSKGLSRNEADEALELMLTGGASDVQIGAFLIAHRIRRPEPQELTGMLVDRTLDPCKSCLRDAGVSTSGTRAHDRRHCARRRCRRCAAAAAPPHCRRAATEPTWRRGDVACSW